MELSLTMENNLIIEDVDIQSMKILYESNLIDKESILTIIKRKSDMYQEL